MLWHHFHLRRNCWGINFSEIHPQKGWGRERSLKKSPIPLYCPVYGFQTLLEDYAAVEGEQRSPRVQLTAGHLSQECYIKSNIKCNRAAMCLSTQSQQQPEDTPPTCCQRY